MNRMKESLLTIHLKDKACKYLKVEPNMKVVSKIINLKEKENKFNQTVIYMKEISKTVYLMAAGY